MNSYQQGVSDALGLKEANIGTPDQLFYPSNYRERAGVDYVRRKLSSVHVAQLLNVHPNSINKWAREGKLSGRRGAKRTGWRKFFFWRFSLKDIEDFLLNYQTLKSFENPVQYTVWTGQEISLLLCGERPEGRSKEACRKKRQRLAVEGKL